MKIIIVGATGTIGQAVLKELEPRHEIIKASYSNSDIQVNIESEDSIKAMFETVGKFDALISVTGKVTFKKLTHLKTADFEVGLVNKLMGQINLVMMGLDYINDKGSFTLTSGILNRDPIPTASSAAIVNGGIDGFVQAAAIEMPREIRINAVSPTVIQESMPKYAAYFRGYKPVSASDAALGYSKSVEGLQTGKVFMV